MTRQLVGNYLKTHRKRSGLSQRELGRLIGYKDQGQVSRFEGGESIPPLRVALAYEAVFRVPVAILFGAMFGTVSQGVDSNISIFDQDLRARKVARRMHLAHTQKMKWLSNRLAAK
jgi:transcriptional regulator with XRE-family HTH domain